MDFLLGFLLGSMSSKKEDHKYEPTSESYHPVREITSILENNIQKTEIKGGWYITMSTKLGVINHLGEPSTQLATGTYYTDKDPGKIKTLVKGNSIWHNDENGLTLVGISI